MKTRNFLWKSFICILLFPCLAWAGGVDNKQNLSASYTASTSRNGAIEGLDTAAYNPAGIVHLQNGLSAGLHVQFISINYEHEIEGSSYKAENYPIIPSVFAVYNKDRWAGYATFTGIGGGGIVEYSEGNIITQKLTNILKTVFRAKSVTNHYAYVESFDYALTTGFSYRATDKLSLSAGLRYVFTTRTAKLNATTSPAQREGTFIQAIYEQEDTSWGGVFGLNYRLSDTLNFGARYETRINLDWETKIPRGSTPTGTALLKMHNREDKKAYARDLPAVLGLGMTWQATDKLSVMPSITLYLEKDSDWGEKNGIVGSNSMDLCLAFGYKIHPKLTLSCGYMYTRVDIDPDDFGIIEQMSPPLDCHSFSLGAKYQFSDALVIQLGTMANLYSSETSQATYLAPNLILGPETEYGKKNYSIAVGFEYSFF